jgi:DNA helicase II / ATP-dependent DNA helicase PcrA
MTTPRVTPAFTKAYASLNEAQKLAVDTIDGPVTVVAGPGTGKTQVLALRIAQILKETDTPPNAILALTFTEAGVYAMRTRLVSLIGTAAYHVRIHTFHGFCNWLIQEHPHQYERLIGSSQITDIDVVTTLRECIDVLGNKLTKLKKFADPYFFVTDIRREISTLKREAVSGEELLRRVEVEKKKIENDPDCIHVKGAHKGKMKAAYVDRLDSLERTRELAQIYAAYTEALHAKRLYDFDDMILETLVALKANADFLQLVQENFFYILADEHQDANTAQNTLLTLLTSYDTNPNLFLVGDDKQAIFSFQGASLAHFRGFKSVFPKALEVTLTDSYRSGTSILDASHALMATSPEHGSRNPKLLSQHAEPHLATITQATYSTEEVECASVVAQVKNLIREGVAANEIAVIYRNNKDAAEFSRAMHNEGILHSVISNQNVLRDHTTQLFISYLRAITKWGDDVSFVRALHTPFVGVSEYEIYSMMLAAKRSGTTTFSLCKQMQNTEDRPPCFEVMQALAQNMYSTDARTLFDKAVRESGFLTYVLGRGDSHDALACLRGLGNTVDSLAKSRGAAKDYTLADFIADLTLYETYDLAIEKDETLVATKGVQLLTAHKSKGLEYAHVFIVHCRDKKWGNTRSMNKFVIPDLENKNDNEDERRLLYVAITRAKLACHISVGLTNSDGSHYLPSVFLAELTEYIADAETTEHEGKYKPEDIFAAVPRAEVPLFDTDFLRAQFVEQGLSATAINNYLECPWKFFYRNLVRVPESMSPAALFGNAIHAALSTYFNKYKQDDTQPTLQILLEAFERELPKQGFFKAEKDEAMQRGIEALTGWYAAYGVLEGSLLGTEQHIDIPLTVGGAAGTVALHGILDRLAVTESGQLVVTDFKTGKPKTRGEVEGSVKNGDGNYKRQLEFYKLLLAELAIQNKGSIGASSPLSHGQIEFVEADTKGRHKREVFMSDELDSIALKNKIIEIVEEIYTFAFWGRDCGDKECEYCILRKSMI